MMRSRLTTIQILSKWAASNLEIQTSKLNLFTKAFAKRKRKKQKSSNWNKNSWTLKTFKQNQLIITRWTFTVKNLNRKTSCKMMSKLDLNLIKRSYKMMKCTLSISEMKRNWCLTWLTRNKIRRRIRKKKLRMMSITITCQVLLISTKEIMIYRSLQMRTSSPTCL